MHLDSASFSVAVSDENTHFDSHKHNEYNLFIQGSHKSWKTWKTVDQFSSHGKHVENER